MEGIWLLPVEITPFSGIARLGKIKTLVNCIATYTYHRLIDVHHRLAMLTGFGRLSSIPVANTCSLRRTTTPYACGS